MNGDGERFTLDTNVLVYSVDVAAGDRHRMALEIVDLAAERSCWLTLQAISEFFAAVTRKGIMPRDKAGAAAAALLEIFPSMAASAAAVRTALAKSVAGQASYWDALLVATAGEGGCTALLTEDLADGAVFDGIRICNPFTPGGIAPVARQLLGMA